MKRILLVACLFVFALGVGLANAPKYYAVSSVEWARVNEICHYAGVVGPTSNGPVTVSQLLVALDRAENVLGSSNSLCLEIRRILENDKAILSDDLGSLNLSFRFSPEVYMTTNGEAIANNSYDRDAEWMIKGAKERNPITSIKVENELQDYLYSKINLGLKQKVSDPNNYWKDAFHTNLSGAGITQNIPSEAGISLGYGSANLMIARDKLSVGEGYTGNTAVGDNYDYQEFLKFGFQTRNTGVNLSITSFDSSHHTELRSATFPSGYLPSTEGGMYDVVVSRFSDYHQLRHVVEYEVIFRDKVRLSLSNINMLDTESAFDFRMMNPFMIFHNMFNYHEDAGTGEDILEANNMISLDLSWSVAPKWHLYGQLSLDQIQLSSEKDYYAEHVEYIDPNAFALLGNVSYTDILGEGLFTTYGEVVWVWPGMYLNEKYYSTVNGDVSQLRAGNLGHCWSQDYLVGYNRTEEDEDDVTWSGYQYGPDCLVVALGGKNSVLGKYDISGRVFYMAHGEKGTGTDPDNYTFAGISDKDTINKLAPTGKVQQTIAVTLEGNYALNRMLSLYAGTGVSLKLQENEKAQQVLQMAFGVTCQL